MASTNETGAVVESNGKVEGWAVVCTGVVTEGSDIVAFKDEAGSRTPVALFTHTDQQKCNRMKKRLATKISKIDRFGGETMVTTTPILGVVPVLMDAPAKRQKATAEETEKPAGGRKKK